MRLLKKIGIVIGILFLLIIFVPILILAILFQPLVDTPQDTSEPAGPKPTPPYIKIELDDRSSPIFIHGDTIKFTAGISDLTPSNVARTLDGTPHVEEDYYEIRVSDILCDSVDDDDEIMANPFGVFTSGPEQCETSDDGLTIYADFKVGGNLNPGNYTATLYHKQEHCLKDDDSSRISCGFEVIERAEINFRLV